MFKIEWMRGLEVVDSTQLGLTRLSDVLIHARDVFNQIRAIGPANPPSAFRILDAGGDIVAEWSPPLH
jgi:hypothetical protein